MPLILNGSIHCTTYTLKLSNKLNMVNMRTGIKINEACTMTSKAAKNPSDDLLKTATY